MSPSDPPVAELLNKGFIVNHPVACAPGGRTFIVTGLHRSGTSLIASILRQVGIFMGKEINDIVHEDEAIVKILSRRDIDALRHLIAARDADYGTWGFKLPMLSQSLTPDHLSLFRDPRVIVTFRDPVSIAVRTALSEYQQPVAALRTVVEHQAALVAFVDRLQCPTLLLSYEKSLVLAGDFIDAVLHFCGLPSGQALRERLIRLIEPNRPSYIGQARRRYEGVIDGVTGGCLYGWCRLTAAAEPVALDLLVDDQPCVTVLADGFRQDLLEVGFGAGYHGFNIDLAEFRPRPDSVIRVRVAAHGIELQNSGRPFAAYIG